MADAAGAAGAAGVADADAAAGAPAGDLRRDDRAGLARGSAGMADGVPAREAPPPAPGIPELHLAGFDGPMDLLLDLAERQRVDLGQISILQLTEQFLAGMDRLERHVPLERRADWLVVATRLLLLHSRLLLPASPEAGIEAAAAAEQELRRLDRLGVLRAAAAGLARRPQLGLEVFARPQGRTPRVASTMALMEACLVLLRGREGQPGASEPSYRPAAGTPFRVDVAMARIRALVEERGAEGVAFVQCLPVVQGDAPPRGPRARAAVASSLVALLELARGGEVLAEQDTALAPILVRQPADPNGAAVHAS